MGRNKIYLEFHGGKFIEDFPHVFTDDGPCDFIVTLRSGFNSSTGHIIKCNHVGQHPYCLVEWAEPRVKMKVKIINKIKSKAGSYFIYKIPEH